MYLDEQWKQVLKKLENELSSVTYDLWIVNLNPIQYVNEELILMAPTITAKNQVNQPAIFEKITKCVRQEFTPYTFVRITEKTEYETNLRKQEAELDKLMQSTSNIKSKFNRIC